MTITPVDSEGRQLSVVSYEGRLADEYSEPYTGEISEGKLTVPLSTDWWKMYYKVVSGGTEGPTQTIVRGVDAMPGINALAEGVKVILEDYRGNMSREVFVQKERSVSSAGS